MTATSIALPLIDSNAREKLRSAADAVKDARESLSKAQLVVDRAEQHLREAQARAASFDSLDEQILQHRIDSLKKGASTALPPELRDMRTEKLNAIDEMTSAMAAAASLRGELAAASAALEDREIEARGLVVEVLAAEAAELIRELESVVARRVQLRLCIQSLEGWSLHYPKVRALTTAAVRIDQMPEFATGNSPARQIAAFWGEFEQRLLADADAQLGSLPDWRNRD